jgi:hypothetical protein
MKTYRFIVYEVETDDEVVNWPNVLPTHRFHRGDVIDERDIKWEVIGVRSSSTEEVWLVDVKRVY